MDAERLFWDLWKCSNESQVDEIISRTPELQNPKNWRPLGEIEGNLGIVENQQANPAAALVEKIVNSIDAVLMRKCYEDGVDPKSATAPQTIEEAVEKYFPFLKHADQITSRQEQALNIQVLADSEPGNRSETSIIIYDAGEGQHPDDFENTFCSLVKSNKNEIRFVQGRYNMGGSGALPFCGDKRYQLIGSKRYDGSGNFGFTLIRKHPRSKEEARSTKNSWYEYLAQNDRVPSFPIKQLDLGLHQSSFRTGSVIKLYSYHTQGNRDMLRDMRRSLNEFLFQPALPYFAVESESRVREHRKAETAFGLSDRLKENEYVEEKFTQEIDDTHIGKIRITVYVFKAKLKERGVKETRKFIRNEFFKNNMSVLFTLNGQVHAHYTTEFISRTLSFDLLKDSVLIHVDCTEMKPEFRDEIFMASRDRLKGSEKAQELRQRLGEVLRQGRLKDILKRRKHFLSGHADDSEALLKEIARNMTFNGDLRKLFGQAMSLDIHEKKRHSLNHVNKIKSQSEFQPKRFPTYFHLAGSGKDGRDFIEIPLDGSKTLRFSSDVENEYFDRVDDPGELILGVMTWRPNDNEGGNRPGTVNEISELLSVARQSPHDGEIKVVLRPSEMVQVGDAIEIKADLLDKTHPDGCQPRLFWVKIADPNRRPKRGKVSEEYKDIISLPEPRLTQQYPGEDERKRGIKSWNDIQQAGIDMDHHVVVHPDLGENGVIEKIIINLDCSVFRNYRTKWKSVDEIELARNRFISSIYFHALFLYTISQQRGHKQTLKQTGKGITQNPVDIVDYLKDLFTHHYADFLLNFQPDEIIEAHE